MHFEPDPGINFIPGHAIYLWIKMDEIERGVMVQNQKQ